MSYTGCGKPGNAFAPAILSCLRILYTLLFYPVKTKKAIERRTLCIQPKPDTERLPVKKKGRQPFADGGSWTRPP
jgi:hypothetical protein